jgi:hypothetical protein
MIVSSNLDACCSRLGSIYITVLLRSMYLVILTMFYQLDLVSFE